MARTVRETFRQYLPGAGKDVLGNPKQGKTRVVASINVTSYAGGGGEALSPADVSLSTIDAIYLRCVNPAKGADANTVREVVYSDHAELFYLIDVDDGGIRTHVDAASAEVVQCIAEGDSAFDVELH